MNGAIHNSNTIMMLACAVLIISITLSLGLHKANSEIRRLSERLDKIESKQETINVVVKDW